MVTINIIKKCLFTSQYFSDISVKCARIIDSAALLRKMTILQDTSSTLAIYI